MRSTISVLLSRSALASALAFVGASSYVYLAQAHAAESASSFCAGIHTGESAANVVARAQSSPEKSWLTSGKHGLSVSFGKDDRFVCAVRFADNHVVAKGVTQVD
jgi:hypothetical protein